MSSEMAVHASPRPTSSSRLRRQRRAILVRVIDGGREVDSFEVSEPQTLREAVRPILAHLPLKDGVVQFKGIEEEWLPLRLQYRRRQAELRGLEEALRFLAA